MSFPQDAETKGLVESFTRLSALADLMREARSEVPDRITVEDSSGALSLTMRGDGAIEDLQIDNDWQDEIEPEDLGDTISALIGEARGGLYEGLNSYIEDCDGDFGVNEGGRVRQDDAPSAVDDVQVQSERLLSMAADQGDVLYSQALEGAYGMLERVDQVVEDLDSLELEAVDVGAEMELDSGESFACESAGRSIVRVAISPGWARTTPTPIIRRELLEVMTSAGDDAEEPNEIESFIGNAERTVVDLLSVLRSFS